MAKDTLKVKDEVVFEQESLQELLDALKKKRYITLGPTVRGGAVIYDDYIDNLPEEFQLPKLADGWTWKIQKYQEQ